MVRGWMHRERASSQRRLDVKETSITRGSFDQQLDLQATETSRQERRVIGSRQFNTMAALDEKPLLAEEDIDEK